jgi:prevent-host-death family protein
MSNVSISQARATLPELLDRVAAGEEVTITRHGVAVAVVMRPDAVRDLVDRGRTTRLSDVPAITPGRAKRLVREVDSSRRAR